ncbi:MAG TPA: D-aminoacyl-tRNA deacylase [Saprospiraceae bacterium]|nr:D-aminoacyl-tRNA deacylase [Saprospiraceae bacterium]
MKVVIQRVSKASVTITGQVKAKIAKGLLVLLGIKEDDDNSDIEWLVPKIISLRIFNDTEEKMNLSVSDIDGDILVISQFTLHASTKKGNRPSFIKAARPDKANQLYQEFVKNLSDLYKREIFTGSFGADMKVELINDGPVTIIIDTKQKE